MEVSELLGLRAVELFEVLRPVGFLVLSDRNARTFRAGDSPGGFPAAMPEVVGHSVPPVLPLQDLDPLRQRIWRLRSIQY